MLTSEALICFIQLWISALIPNGNTTAVSLGGCMLFGIIKKFKAKLKGFIQKVPFE